MVYAHSETSPSIASQTLASQTLASQAIASQTLKGIGLVVCGWAVFSMQDAIVKYLVTTLPVPEVLLARSVIITLLASLALRRSQWAVAGERNNLASIVVRGAMILVAWFAYYRASRSMPLADLVTLYFAAPLFVIALASIALREVVGPWRWLAAIVGFAGVLIAADFGDRPDLTPSLLALFASFCWAITTVLARSLSQHVTTAALMVGSNLMFVIVCGIITPFMFVDPGAKGWLLMGCLGLCGTAGQFFLFEGLRRAPASAVAPFEYSALGWAMFWGFIVFGDVPGLHVIGGGVVILCAGLFAVYVESRARIIRAPAALPPAVLPPA